MRFCLRQKKCLRHRPLCGLFFLTLRVRLFSWSDTWCHFFKNAPKSVLRLFTSSEHPEGRLVLCKRSQSHTGRFWGRQSDRPPPSYGLPPWGGAITGGLESPCTPYEPVGSCAASSKRLFPFCGKRIARLARDMRKCASTIFDERLPFRWLGIGRLCFAVDVCDLRRDTDFRICWFSVSRSLAAPGCGSEKWDEKKQKNVRHENRKRRMR